MVLIDNTSTNVSKEVEEAIRETGAILIYGAPYCPHLKTIKNYVNLYEACLKRNECRMMHYWRKVHCEDLNVVDRDAGIKYFRRCDIPGSRKWFTHDECKQFVNQLKCVC